MHIWLENLFDTWDFLMWTFFYRNALPSVDRLDKAEMAFKLYDKDKDGYITKAEMVKLSKNLTKDQIDRAFARFDSDGDGRLSYAEFKKMMHK